MRAYERLLDYVKVYTTSDPESGTHPSAAREFDLAHKLVEELKALGEMYVADERFRENIDKAGGEGTATFASKAIAVYCGR